MKAIYCKICHSLVQMTEEIKICVCGNVCGKYLDGHRVVVHAIFPDWIVPLAIANPFLDDDIRKAREGVKMDNNWNIKKYELDSKDAESCGIFEKKECTIETDKRFNNLKVVLISELLKDEIRKNTEKEITISVPKFEKKMKDLKKENIYRLFYMFIEMKKDFYGRFVKEYDPDD